MKAPEKIYLHPDIGDKEFIRPWLKRPFNENSIEYARTDAFIEKAAEWLRKNADNYTWYDESEGESGMVDGFIEVFKNYMKEE